MKNRTKRGRKASPKKPPEKRRKISDKGLIALVLVIVALLAAAPMTAVAAVNLQEKHPQVFRESTGNEPFFSEIGELTQIGVTPENGPARAAAQSATKAVPQTGTLYSIYTSSFPKGAPGNTGTWGNLSTCVSHAMQIGGSYNAAYCLDKELGYQAGAGHTTAGTTIDDIKGLKRETIGFILANGFQWNSGSIWSQTDNDQWLVTQLLIWAAKDGKITIDKATHQISVPKSIRSDIVKISSKVYNSSGFTAYYDSLVLKLEKVRKIPSFCSYPEETLDGVKLAATKENALLLTGDSSGRYSRKEVDKNNVLANYSAALTKAGFIPDVTISASGSTLSLSTNIAEKSGKNAAAYKPNGGAGAVVAWRYAPDPSHYQRFASATPATSEVKALLSIGADTAIPSGGPKITKWSEDGIVAGIPFGISGSDGSYRTRTTDSNGEIDLSDLPLYEKKEELDDDGNPTGEMVDDLTKPITYTMAEITPLRYVPNPQIHTYTPAGSTRQTARKAASAVSGISDPLKLFDDNLDYFEVATFEDDRVAIKIQDGQGNKLGVCYALEITNGDQVYHAYTDPDGIVLLKDFDLEQFHESTPIVTLAGYFMDGSFHATEAFRGSDDAAEFTYSFNGKYFFPLEK